MRAARYLAIALLSLLTSSACDKPDVGARCTLSWNSVGSVPAPTPTTAQADYIDTGNIDCDDLVCIVSPAEAGTRYGSCSGGACGYCSKPCVSDRDCYSGKTELKCVQLVLDEAFLNSLDEQTRQRYLGDTENVRYCAVAR